MPAWAKVAIEQWVEAAVLGEGRIFRPMNRHGQITGEILLPQNIPRAGPYLREEVGVPHLAPHDLRRTFAKLAHGGRAALEQIQLSLGHAYPDHRALSRCSARLTGCPLRSPRAEPDAEC